MTEQNLANVVTKEPFDPPCPPCPVCARCGKKSILGYLRLLDTNPMNKRRESGSWFIFDFDDLDSYGGSAVYLGFYKNYNGAPGLSPGSWNLFACGNCWKELLIPIKAADEAAWKAACEAIKKRHDADQAKKRIESRTRDGSPTRKNLN